MKKSLSFSILIILFLSLINFYNCQNNEVIGAVSGYLDNNLVSSIFSLIQNKQLSNFTFGSISTTYKAVKVFKLLNTNVPNSNELCNLLELKLQNVERVREAYYLIETLKILECSNSNSNSNSNSKLSIPLPVINDIRKIFAATIQSEANLARIYFAISLVSSFSSSLTHENFDYNSIINYVLRLKDDSGSFKSSISRGAPTVSSAALAYRILARLLSTNSLNKHQIYQIQQVAKEIINIFEQTDNYQGTIFFEEESLEITSEVVSASAALIAHFPQLPILFQSKLVGIAEFFIQRKHVATIDDAYFLLTGLHAFDILPTPIVLILQQNSIEVSSKSNDNLLKVSVTDLFGNNMNEFKVYLESAYPVTTRQSILSHQQMQLETGSEGSRYSINFLALKPEPGVYELKFSASTISTTRNVINVQLAIRSIKIVTAVSVHDFEISVQELSSSTGKKTSLQFGEVLTQSLKANSAQKLVITLKLKNQVSLKPLSVQQCFVRLYNQQQIKEIVELVKFERNRYSFEFAFDGKKEIDNLVNGEYSIELIVGDSILSNSFIWQIGKINLEIAENNNNAAQLGISSRPVFAPLPEIRHIFRNPDKRPTEMISFVFTSLVVALPFGLLLSGINSIGFNLKRFPLGFGFFSAIAFVLLLLSILVLFSFFWLILTMIQTLTILFILSIPTFYFGLTTFRNINRLSKTDKED
eukprot:TRINITY_DN381_c2_g2_i1.p1 TRINITY_DN381_c2_g2~~TRINITY_DN381_c2_g2_i1.p1  ORF type:complete len:701 (+),score=337.30 TRINITY_DN381_c2_g2_i1:74-2176(+)